jgi:DNA recombination protein RmuC
MEIILISLAVLIGCLSFLMFYFFLRERKQNVRSSDENPMVVMQQYVESLRSDVRTSLQQVSENVNQQLMMITNQMQSQTSTVGNRLDTAARVIGDVQKNLGELGQAAKEIKEVGQNVAKLEELLRSPKLRGGIGEFLLEDLLKQVIPSKYFQMQYQFRNGQTVDAVIMTSNHLVPIDSKFPLDNFRKMVTSVDEQNRKVHRKTFMADVKKHIDSIASKYILPDEKTFPFALMYIPAENIYYEVIIRDEGVSDESGVYSYAIDQKVIPVSPNTLYAYLQVIALGLRGLYIEQSANEVLNSLSRLQGDLAKVRDVFDTLGSHLDNALKKYEDVNKKLSSVEGRLESVAEKKIEAGRSDELPAH